MLWATGAGKAFHTFRIRRTTSTRTGMKPEASVLAYLDGSPIQYPHLRGQVCVMRGGSFGTNDMTDGAGRAGDFTHSRESLGTPRPAVRRLGAPSTLMDPRGLATEAIAGPASTPASTPGAASPLPFTRQRVIRT